MEEQKEPQSSYKKRSPWQWILIYAVVGIVVYGLIYYFFLAKKDNGPYTQNTQTAVTAPATLSQDVQTPTTAAGQITQTEGTGISLTKTGFLPQTITVKAGTKVTWTNDSGVTATVNSAVHPTHQVYPPLNLGEFADGETLSLVFDTPGTYKYHNHLNTSQTGTVVVE